MRYIVICINHSCLFRIDCQGQTRIGKSIASRGMIVVKHGATSEGDQEGVNYSSAVDDLCGKEENEPGVSVVISSNSVRNACWQLVVVKSYLLLEFLIHILSCDSECVGVGVIEFITALTQSDTR
jgi:hypothetical protein